MTSFASSERVTDSAMSTGDDGLSDKLERLEIAAVRPAASGCREENPFKTGRRRQNRRPQRPVKTTVAFKGKTALDKSTISHAIYCSSPVSDESPSPSYLVHPNPSKVKICKLKEAKADTLHRNVHSLIYDCSRLRISGEAIQTNSSHNSRSRSKNSPRECDENSNDRAKSDTPSCSQQALNPPCDITIDELASYFETFVHIPRKMTSMAEMMYT